MVSKQHRFPIQSLPVLSVTVFYDRAEVKRKCNVRFQEGTHEVFVEGLSSYADQKSIRVDGSSNVVIQEVQLGEQPVTPLQLCSADLLRLETERKVLVSERERLEDRKTVLRKEVEVFDALISQVGSSVVTSPLATDISFTISNAKLKNLAQFFDFYAKFSIKKREEIRDCNAEQCALDSKIKKLAKEIVQIKNGAQSKGSVAVILYCDQEADVELVISYQVYNASWRPAYDIRVKMEKDGKCSLKLSYFGKIEQKTEEDWINVFLTLSTARSTAGGHIPAIGTMNAVLCSPRSLLEELPSRTCSQLEFERELSNEDFCEVASIAHDFLLQEVGPVEDTVFSTSLNVGYPTTILCSSGKYKVVIRTMNTEPLITYETVPCKDQNVYALATTINTSSFPLVAGEASIYLNDSFISKVKLKAVFPGERFSFSLGVDPAVRVVYKAPFTLYKEVPNSSKCALIIREQAVVLKNGHLNKAFVRLKEQIPKSSDEQIKVRLLSPQLDFKPVPVNEALKLGMLSKHAVELDENHNLVWTFDVEPEQEKELLVKWSVQYPVDRVIELAELSSFVT